MGEKRPKTMTQFVTDSLRDELLSGRLKAGTRLTQNEVSQKLGVSSTPIREAFKILTTIGLLDFDEHKGVIVKGLTFEKLNEIYELRTILEPMLIKKAFEFVSNDDINEAYEVHKASLKTTDINEWINLNSKFHSIFWSYAKNTLVYGIVENLRINAYAYISLSLHTNKSHIITSNNDHLSLIDAFKNKNLNAILHINDKHLKDTLNIIKELVFSKKNE